MSSTRFRPGALRGGDVARAILRLPGEPFAHCVPGDLIAEFSERVAFCGVPGAFDELHHADAVAAAEHAQGETEGGRRFSLASAGMDDEKALLDFFLGDLGILHRFALRHFGAMAFGFGLVDRFRHGVSFRAPFTATGKPATMRTTRSARAAMRWLRRPCKSRNFRPSG